MYSVSFEVSHVAFTPNTKQILRVMRFHIHLLHSLEFKYSTQAKHSRDAMSQKPIRVEILPTSASDREQVDKCEGCIYSRASR